MFPSGSQFEIASGGYRAVVTSVGATLRDFQFGQRPLLDGFAADEMCSSARGQVLMPWPNRIADGSYQFSGKRYDLAINERALGHAIHGLVRWANWRVEASSQTFVDLRHTLHAQPGYPFDLELAVEYRVSASGLEVSMKATNVGRAACPFGAGVHPYFVFPGIPVDAVELCVPGQDWIDVDARSIPVGHRPVAGSPLDFLQPRLVGAARIDHAFGSLERDAEGAARVRLRHDKDVVVVWLDGTFDFVEIYTGDTLPDATRRRRSVAVEPMTCAPNAFNSGDGLRVLRPGEAYQGSWGMGFHQLP